MTYEELLERQQEILEECDELQKSNRLLDFFDKMQEFADLGERYLSERFIKEVFKK